MVWIRYIIENGNVLLWSGKTPPEIGRIDNIIITYGGMILFLKTEFILNLNNPSVLRDFDELPIDEFSRKYRIPILTHDISIELKNIAKMFNSHRGDIKTIILEELCRNLMDNCKRFVQVKSKE